MSYYPPVSPYEAGLGCKCPRCAQGDLFAGFLKLHDSCAACGLDYSKADSGDGPAVFMMFIVGFAATIVLFMARFAFQAPIWLALLLGFITTIGLIMVLMRPLKSLMIALQFQHKAAEGSQEEDPSDWA